MKIKREKVNNCFQGQSNDVMIDFLTQMEQSFGDQLLSIVLTGSYARGEAKDHSDIDLWCFFQELSGNKLRQIGKIINNLSVSYDTLEINTQCVTLDEFQNKGFAKAFGGVFVDLEGITLLGQDLISAPNLEQVVSTIEEILAQTLLSNRHYMTTPEPTAGLLASKLQTYVLKPLSFALRLERYVVMERYPFTLRDLFFSYPESKQKKVIQWLLKPQQLQESLESDSEKTLDLIHESAIQVSNAISQLKSDCP